MPLNPRDLIDCLRAMSDGERREVAGLLLGSGPRRKPRDIDAAGAGASGVERATVLDRNADDCGE